MGCLCCCFHIKEPEDGQNCIIRALWGKKYKALGNKEQLDAPTSTAQVGTDTPSNSDASSNNFQTNTTTSPPRTLQFNSDAATCKGQKQAEEQIREKENIQVIEMIHVGKGNKSEASSELSEEDEDVCPICLEEYIPENPAIVLQCSHRYHLSCIYEWMERSITCPFCTVVMIFEEAA